MRSFPLRDADDKAAMVAHIIPIRRSALEIFAGSYALLVLTPVAAPTAPPIELMRSLFDLTPSEARVARGLAAGETLEEIAANGGVAISTVRSQLRQVLEKTGCTRQAEVVSLLANVSLDRERGQELGSYPINSAFRRLSAASSIWMMRLRAAGLTVGVTIRVTGRRQVGAVNCRLKGKPHEALRHSDRPVHLYRRCIRRDGSGLRRPAWRSLQGRLQERRAQMLI